MSRPRVRITRQLLLAVVELFEGEQRVALTTTHRDVQRSDLAVRRLVAGHYHRPMPRESAS